MNSGLSGYVLIHPYLGVYLGRDDGQHYWSKANPAHLLIAIVFPELGDAREFIRDWPAIGAASVVPAQADIARGGYLFATMQTLVKAGICEGWLGPSTPCCGRVQ
jgi:hypothetical protein